MRIQIGWICLLIISLGISVFSVIVAAFPSGPEALLYRADGLASFGLGLNGALSAIVPFRRVERWAWWTLWCYPAFWLAHPLGDLAPATDHIHQVVFIAHSLIGLMVPAGWRFWTTSLTTSGWSSTSSPFTHRFGRDPRRVSEITRVRQ